MAKWGLAAWSEGIITKGQTGAYGTISLPKTKGKFEQTFIQSSYQASKVWSSITLLVDQSNEKLPLPKGLLQTKYIDGKPVFQDHYLKGTVFIHEFLKDLGQEDKRLSQQNNWEPYNWKDSTQKSHIYNKNILSVLHRKLEKLQRI